MVVKCQVAIKESKLSYIKDKSLFEQFLDISSSTTVIQLKSFHLMVSYITLIILNAKHVKRTNVE